LNGDKEGVQIIDSYFGVGMEGYDEMSGEVHIK